MGRWTLRELNGWDRVTFGRELGGIFEHSPWVAEGAWAFRPFTGVGALHGAMLEVVRNAGEEALIILLRAHPDLGARMSMTDDSKKEQSGAGLDRLDRREYRYMLALNRLYKAKFGFPFIIAVKGMGKEAILESMRTRCRNNRAAELDRALAEVGRITRFRLEEALAAE